MATGGQFSRILHYIKWLTTVCIGLSEFLTEDGSLVIEVGNSWEEGNPTMSTLSIEALLSVLKKSNLYLCQQFIWYNTASFLVLHNGSM